MPFAVAPTFVAANESRTITLTGTSTTWSGSTVFTVSGITGASVTSQTVTSTTAATIVVSIPAGATGTLTISDGAGSTQTVTVLCWRTLKDDSFARADTVVGAAGTQSGVGGGWVDYAGNVWRIKDNTLFGVPSATVPGNMLVRVPSENITGAQKVTLTKRFDSNNQTFSVVLRQQSDGSHYEVFLSASALRMRRVTSAQVATTLISNVIAPAFTTSQTVEMTFEVVDIGGNPQLWATATIPESGFTSTVFFSDTNAAKITASGRAGFDGSTNAPTPSLTATRLRTFYSNAAYATASPASALANQTNLTVTLTGVGTAWVPGSSPFTLIASGSNGAAIVSQTVSSATAATLVINTGTANDSLVIADSTSGTRATVAIDASTLAISPANLAADRTGLTITVTGNNQKWLTSAPSFSFSGVTGLTITNVSVTSDTSATLTLTTGSATGTATLTDATYPATATANVVKLIALNDTNVALTPFNWRINGALWAEANYAGAGMRFAFTTSGIAPLQLFYDPAPNIANGLGAGNYPVLAFSIDGGPWQRAQVGPNVGGVLTLAATLAAGTHLVDIRVQNLISSTSDTGRFNPSATKLRVLGLRVDPSATLSAAPRRAKTLLALGDSITAGANAAGSGDVLGVYSSDADLTYARAIADTLGAELGSIGLPGQTWNVGTTRLPALYKTGATPPDTYSYYEAGVSRLVGGKFSPAPDYLTINMGTNDGPGIPSSEIVATLTDLRAMCSAATVIGVIIPFGRSQATNITTGFNAYRAATGDPNAYLVDCGNDIANKEWIDNSSPAFNATRATPDGLHPLAQYGLAFGARAAALLASQIAARQATTRTLATRQPNRPPVLT